jgi:hypothetical protein
MDELGITVRNKPGEVGLEVGSNGRVRILAEDERGARVM